MHREVERVFDPGRPVLAASIAVFRDGLVLLAARGKPPMAGVYSLPGGVVERGETLAEAALRELREEVGVEAEILGFVTHVEIIEREPSGAPARHFVIAAHAGRWLSGEPSTGPEALEIRWVDPGNLAGLSTTPGLADVLAKAAAITLGSTS
jgi:ADP-ribose pyrophosphatase YjhB (NUDIX family)